MLRLLGLVALIAGCSSLPSFGPSSDSIMDAAEKEQSKQVKATTFRLIDITQATLPIYANQNPVYFSTKLNSQKLLQNNQQVMQGDVILIRIWEAGDDGLFASSGQRETNFSLSVSNDGNIDVPYAGSVSVLHKTVQEIRQILLKRFNRKAIDPEINVEIKATNSLGVPVLGAVAAPGRITIPSQGIYLLDLLAMAGGVPHSSWENTLTLVRNGFSETLPLNRILEHARNNVVVLPGDTIQIEYVPRKFAVYGAISKSGNMVIDNPAPTLSDLLAESGGLNNMQAEASSVFVFRPVEKSAITSTTKATAYRLNFSKPDAFLLASQFEIASKDIIYVATADASEFRKFLIMLLSPLIGSSSSIQNLGK